MIIATAVVGDLVKPSEDDDELLSAVERNMIFALSLWDSWTVDSAIGAMVV